MAKTVKLITRAYLSPSLEIGMLFSKTHRLGEYIYEEIYELKELPHDPETYLQENGHPVQLYLAEPKDNNNDSPMYIIAQPHQIGWVDEGENTETLRDIKLYDINSLLYNEDGWVEIHTTEDGEIELFEGKVIMLIHDEYLDDYEDMDWDDDLTQYDPQDYKTE
jgi:hypothetical protein